VFTVPHQVSELMLQNKRLLYNVLFRCVSATLLEVAANPKRLGAYIGFLRVLHTWGQAITRHPHLQCVVPAGLRSRRATRGCALGLASDLLLQLLPEPPPPEVSDVGAQPLSGGAHSRTGGARQRRRLAWSLRP